MPDKILADTKYLRLIDRDGWFFVERCGGSGVVTIVALTNDRKVLLVEQLRRALGRPVIELPAGLVGDEARHEGEPSIEAARRELLEETGYAASSLEPLMDCASSPGLTDEVVSFFLARDLKRVGAGGGTADESIQVHEIPIDEVDDWLQARHAGGTPIAAKVYTGLYLASRRLGKL